MATEVPNLATPSRILATAVVAVSCFAFVAATPPFSYGVWFQAEPATVALVGAGALAAFALCLLDLTGHQVGNVLVRPHMRVFLAFLGWNAIASCFHPLPGRTWFGTPENGESILSFGALFVLSWLATVLWPFPRSRMAMVAAAASVALIVGGLTAFVPFGSPWRPEKFGGYAGLIGPAAALAILGLFRRPDRRTYIAAAIVGLAPIASSSNRTALGLFCAVGPVVLLLGQWMARRQPLHVSRARLASAPILAIAVAGAVVGAALWYGHHDPTYSIWSRGLLLRAGFMELIQHPALLLTGTGWGSYNDILYRHTFMPGVHAFEKGEIASNWEGIYAGAFHSHNDFFEALLAGGLPSAVLFVWFFVALVGGSRRHMLPVAATAWTLIAGSLTFWFPFMFAVPLLAIAIAAGSAPFAIARETRPQSMGAWGGAATVATGLILGWGALGLRADAENGGIRLAALQRQDLADVAMLGTFPDDHGRGGVHLWWLTLSDAQAVGNILNSGQTPSPGTIAWYARLMDETDSWIDDGRAGTRLRGLSLALRNDLAHGQDTPVLSALRVREQPKWEGILIREVRADPERTDMAVPYLSFLTLRGLYGMSLDACTRLSTIRPNDRVCLWFSGLAKLTAPTTEAEGIASMHRALLLDADAVVPIPPAARQMVEAVVAPGQKK